MYCYGCEQDFNREDMHTGQTSKPQLCKSCYTEKRKARRLANVSAQNARYAEQQADRKASREAKAKADAAELLTHFRQAKSAPGKSKAWQRVDKKRDEMEMNRLIRGEL